MGEESRGTVVVFAAVLVMAALANAVSDNSNLMANPTHGTCITNKIVAPPQWFLKKVSRYQALNVSDSPMLSYYGKYAGVGMGYISEIEGWASWGLQCIGGKTVVRVWSWPKDVTMRCTKNAMLPYYPYKSYYDYSMECN